MNFRRSYRFISPTAVFTLLLTSWTQSHAHFEFSCRDALSNLRIEISESKDLVVSAIFGYLNASDWVGLESFFKLNGDQIDPNHLLLAEGIAIASERYEFFEAINRSGYSKGMYPLSISDFRAQMNKRMEEYFPPSNSSTKTIPVRSLRIWGSVNPKLQD